jgi:ribosomal protein L33
MKKTCIQQRLSCTGSSYNTKDSKREKCHVPIYSNQKYCRSCGDVVLFGSVGKANAATQYGFDMLFNKGISNV